MGRKPKAKPDNPTIGHNSGQITADNQRKLQNLIGEIERIDRVIALQKMEIAEIFKSAKDSNFDTKAMRAVVRERRVEKSKRAAFEAVMDAYRHALGMLADTPLGQAAVHREATRIAPAAPATSMPDMPAAPPPPAA